MLPPSDAPESQVIGTAPAFQQLLRPVERVAPINRALLISGPTGSDNEVLAQLIHRRGSNPDAPFVDVNCGAIPEHLVETELFGHVKGAFTGASENRIGHFEVVGAGTLFLDEIGELPMPLQPNILRALETRTFRPVGSSEVRSFGGRIVAATHRDLWALVREGRFREDLYYRLAVFVLDIPGIDQRKDDIPALVSHFATLQSRPLSFTASALEQLRQHPWPGHIRELRSMVDRLAVLAQTSLITVEIVESFLPSVPMTAPTSLDAVADTL